jgi:hypothetical protein
MLPRAAALNSFEKKPAVANKMKDEMDKICSNAPQLQCPGRILGELWGEFRAMRVKAGAGVLASIGEWKEEGKEGKEEGRKQMMVSC